MDRTPCYKKGRTFVYIIMFLVVKQQHENIQMRSQNIMLRKILAYVGVNVSVNIPHVPDIASITNIYTTSTSNITHPPIYERLHSNLLPEK